MTALVVDSEAALEDVSVTAVTAVAEVLDRDPMAIGPLHDAIDPDALDRLFSSGSMTAQEEKDRVTFSIEGCEVTAYADGRLEVIGPDTLGQTNASN